MIGVELSLLASQIKLLLLDFDGVLTSNTVYVLEDGRESVRCWRGDGIGIFNLKKLGIKVCVVSKETNLVVAARCKKLQIDCIQSCDDKESAVKKLAMDEGVPLSQISFVGNDINDIPALKIIGLPIIVADAHKEVFGFQKYVTKVPGGHGAVREVCDLICSAVMAHREMVHE